VGEVWAAFFKKRRESGGGRFFVGGGCWARGIRHQPDIYVNGGLLNRMCFTLLI